MGKSTLGDFEKYRIGPKIRLADIDPGQTPFLGGNDSKNVERLESLAIELDHLQDLLYANAQQRLLLVLQGMDTSGKDGTLRWVFSRTSPLGTRVTSFKAPTEEEKSRDFLWRCHAAVPRAGEIMVWNRSHYEDVLVPVVNRWIDKDATENRYEQIRDFESLLIDSGTVIVKCMLHISYQEQGLRLQARIDDPAKHWKFSLTDLEVRKQWPQYQKAYDKALRETSTKKAPWYVVPADNKLHRNLMIARLLVQVLQNLKLQTPAANPMLAGLKVE